MTDDTPLTLDWLRETGRADMSRFSHGPRIHTGLNYPRCSGSWSVHIGAGTRSGRRVWLYCARADDVCWFELPQRIRTRADFRSLWRALTGEEWGA